jgi:serine/threonine-protein kinase HipA
MSEPGIISYLRMYMHLPDGNRRPIGYLSSYGDIMRVSFDEDYIQNPERPTLSLAYRGADDDDTRAILQSKTDERVTQQNGRWPAYFSNLLPEAHNRERLALERNCLPEDEFQLLAAAGHDLMGGLEVEPTPRNEDIPVSVRHWHTAMGLDVLEPGFVEMPVPDAAAIPGVVTKFSAILDGRRYVVKRDGEAGSHIIKLPSSHHPDMAINEYFGFQMCDVLGLECAEASLVTPDEAELPEKVQNTFDFVLAVKRFDREAGRRVHMEEFAQAMNRMPKNKYGKDLISDYGLMLRLLDQYSVEPVRDVLEFLNRFVVFVLMGNVDAHLKNWALLYRDGISPQLSPLYDPLCVTSYFDPNEPAKYGHNRRIDELVRAFTWDDLRELIRVGGIQRGEVLVRRVKETAKRALHEWPPLMEDDFFPDSMRVEIMERLKGKVRLSQID